MEYLIKLFFDIFSLVTIAACTGIVFMVTVNLITHFVAEIKGRLKRLKDKGNDKYF